MSGRDDIDLSVVLPPRLALFGAPRGEAFRVPSALMTLLNIPFFVSLLFVVLDLSIRIHSGYGLFEDGTWVWPALVSAPAAAADLLYLFGRLEWVHSLPDPGRRDPPPPPVLALPGGAAEGGLRPVDVRAPSAPLGRRSVDGVLFAGALASLAIALGLALVQQESFDSVLGLKLGGIPFRGTYWNRWWFVFYGFVASGASMLAASAGLFIRRLNRKGD